MKNNGKTNKNQVKVLPIREIDSVAEVFMSLRRIKSASQADPDFAECIGDEIWREADRAMEMLIRLAEEEFSDE